MNKNTHPLTRAQELSHLESSKHRSARAKLERELGAITTEMRERKVNGKRSSPTLVAWADRIDAAVANAKVVL